MGYETMCCDKRQLVGCRGLGFIPAIAAVAAKGVAGKQAVEGIAGKIKGLFGKKKKKKKPKPAVGAPAAGRAATMEVSLDKVVMYGGVGLLLLLSAYIIVRASR